MKYYKVNDYIDGDYLYRIKGQKVENYCKGNWIKSDCNKKYILRFGKEITEKEAFIEALTDPPYEININNIIDELTEAAANQLRDLIDRDVINNIWPKV